MMGAVHMQITTIGLDIAKNVFQVHGIDGNETVVVRKQLRRGKLIAFFESLAPCLVGIEACATAHHWARELTVLGDSEYPAAPVAGGSVTTASVCNCVAQACDEIRAELGINDPQGDVLAALKSRGRGAIEHYAEWKPKGAPESALEKLYSGHAE